MAIYLGKTGCSYININKSYNFEVRDDIITVSQSFNYYTVILRDKGFYYYIPQKHRSNRFEPVVVMILLLNMM